MNGNRVYLSCTATCIFVPASTGAGKAHTFSLLLRGVKNDEIVRFPKKPLYLSYNIGYSYTRLLIPYMQKVTCVNLLNQTKGDEMSLNKNFAATLLFLVLMSPLVVEAEWKPTETIKVYVGLQAGGGVDTVARVFTNKLAENTGWNFTVINKTGGGGSVALKSLKNEKPDGLSIIFTPSEIITFNPTMNPNIGYTYTDFTPLAAVSNTQMGLICMGDKPWKTFADAVEASKAGEKVSVAYQAQKMGLMMKIIQKKLGAEFVLVPVKGGSAGMKNLLGNHVDIAWGAGIQAKYVKTGQMKVLASVRDERLTMAPEAPTLKELGVEEATYNVNFMFAAPKGLDPEAAEALSREIKKAAESEEINDLIANKLDLEAIYIAGAELEKTWKML
jgi:tripartite-type tricarboxylate transporter receptor subunit TctC